MIFGDPVLPDRFWDKVIPEPMSGCWLWLGATNDRGYGQLWDPIKHTAVYVHRLIILSIFGRLKRKHDIDHKCTNRICVNPDHLHEVTHLVNCQLRSQRARERLRIFA